MYDALHAYATRSGLCGVMISNVFPGVDHYEVQVRAYAQALLRGPLTKARSSNDLALFKSSRARLMRLLTTALLRRQEIAVVGQPTDWGLPNVLALKYNEENVLPAPVIGDTHPFSKFERENYYQETTQP